MMELLAFAGGFWFLTFIGFIFLLGILSSELDNFVLGVATFILALAGAQFLFGMPVWSTIVDNPFSLVLFLFIFNSAGALYTAFWMWPEFLRENSQSIMEGFKYAKESQHSRVKTFDDYLDSPYYKFKASRHKERLATWIITWPFSITWELSRKPIKYAYRVLYNLLGSAFENIGTSVARGIHDKNK